ncbi:MAG: hypothetical protein P4L50_19050, partial [Anaerolineaceae bacterium]|nr:hypothetical protein [Anaerolineaceae bacterium]
MASQTISEVHRIHRLIWAFNHEVEFSSAYSNRKNVLTTPTVFFDFEGDKLPPMAPAPDGWCRISAQLEAQLVQYQTEVHMIEFDERHERILLDNREFMDACKVEVPKYLNKLAYLYLNCFHMLADGYEPDVKERVKAKALSLIQDFEENRIDHKDYISIVEYIKQQIRAAIKAGSEPPPPVHHKLTRTELTEKVLKLQGERTYSIKDICTICRISQYKYYTIIKEHKRRERGIEEVKRGPGAKSRLNTEHIK